MLHCHLTVELTLSDKNILKELYVDSGCFENILSFLLRYSSKKNFMNYKIKTISMKNSCKSLRLLFEPIYKRKEINQLFQNIFYEKRKWGFAIVSTCKMSKIMQIKVYLTSCLRIYPHSKIEEKKLFSFLKIFKFLFWSFWSCKITA